MVLGGASSSGAHKLCLELGGVRSSGPHKHCLELGRACSSGVLKLWLALGGVRGSVGECAALLESVRLECLHLIRDSTLRFLKSYWITRVNLDLYILSQRIEIL